VEQLKHQLLLNWKAVKSFQEGSEMWKQYDHRVNDLIELLYGTKSLKSESIEACQPEKRDIELTIEISKKI